MVTRFRSCLGANGMRVATDGRRHLRSGMRTPFTRPPRNRSWRPPSQRVGLHARDTEEATEVPEASGSIEDEGRQRPRRLSTVRRSEKRAVKRDSPQPRLRRTAPSPKTPASRVLGRAGQHAKRTFAWSSTEPRGSGTRATSSAAERRRAKHGSCAGKRRGTGARVGTVSECRSRSDASTVATPGRANSAASDTRDLARGSHWGQTGRQR